MSSKEELKYHLVFVTKYRYNLLNKERATILKNYFVKQQDKLGYVIQSLTIESNHVHILFNLNSSKQDLNEIIQKIKGGSSFLLRKKFPKLKQYASLWTPSHFVSTVGNVSQETIKNYIENQGLEETEIIQKTFKFKVLAPTKHKLEKLELYFNECKNLSKDERDRCPSSIHQDFTYHKCKADGELELYIRQQNSKVVERPTKLAKYWLRISGSKKSKAFWLGLQGRIIPEDYAIKDGKIQRKGNNLYFNLVVEKEKVVNRVNPKRLISIDLGFNHPIASVTLVDGHMVDHKFYGKQIKDSISRRERRYGQLQHSGIETPGVSRYTNRTKQLIHEHVNDIIDRAIASDCDIVIGDLRGLKSKMKKGRSSKTTRKKGRVPYFKIAETLIYKAKLHGIGILRIPEHYTSQTCSRCGNVDKSARQGERYICKSCKYQNQADLNGATNIARGTGRFVEPPSSGSIWAWNQSDLKGPKPHAEDKPTALAVGR